MSAILAVDLGGTHLRVARFDKPEPPAQEQIKVPTMAAEGPQAVINRLQAAIESLLPRDRDGLRIAIGAPGPLDPYQGIILHAPNLQGWTNIPLKEELETRLGLTVLLGNDANLAALGEWKFGAGRGTNHLIYLTISTGIGGGVITNGKLLLGARGLAAELGHVTLDLRGPRCSCGQLGHIEALASGTAIAERAAVELQAGRTSSLQEVLITQGKLSASDVGRAAQDGDGLALEIIDSAACFLGHHLADLTHVFNPEVIVLGGGVSALGSLLFEPMQRSLHEHIMDDAYLLDLRISPAELGDDAGLVGAMTLATQI
jgi:glucokinase